MLEITTSDTQVVPFRRDVRDLLSRKLLEAVEIVLEEELADVLGTQRYERQEQRRGYRNGKQSRRVTTSIGVRDVQVPRGRIDNGDGTTSEFRSQLLPRYARRTREVDEAILGVYLAGGNSRRIRKALAPMLGDENLSKSAVSRVVGRLKAHFAAWAERELSAESYPIIYLDGINLKVRLARRVVNAPVLAVLGVAEDGRKQLVSLRLCVSEASTHWSSVIENLQRRGLHAPLLVITDGHGGLRKAVEGWPGVKVQRCTVHKWRNLVEHCPAHARRELRRDYHAIVWAKTGLAARKAYDVAISKWTKLCPAVARSLADGGLNLLTFYEFPVSMRKSLRSTNAVENLNREFRRRTKTQASFATEEAAITLLYGLVAFGQIEFRRIAGHRDLPRVVREEWNQAA